MGDSPGQNWAVYEANVQQYRVLSATVQSFLLTVGSIFFTSSQSVPGLLLMMIFALGVAHVLWIWIPVVYARHKVVDYYKFQHDRRLSEEDRLRLASMCTEKQYVKSARLRRQVNAEFFGDDEIRVWRLTRIKFDLVVPLAYVAFWAGMAAWKKPWALALWT